MRAGTFILLALLVAGAGGTPSPAWTTPDLYNGSSWIYSCAAAGDVNGDGYADIVLGLCGAYEGFGGVQAYYGGPDGYSTEGPDWVASGAQVDDAFGWSVAQAGDVNGDGYGDIVVGAPLTWGGSGAIYVYAGGENGLPANGWPTWSAGGEGGQFGICVARAGDVDGDGRGEILVGANAYRRGPTDIYPCGRAYAYSVGSAGLTRVWEAHGEDFIALDPEAQWVAHFGASLSTAGDVNGDGCDDVIVGAPTVHQIPPDATGHQYQSRAYVFHGSVSGLAANPAWFRKMDQQDSTSPDFGMTVTPAGDMNGDGCDDVLVAAPGYEEGGGVLGKIFLYYGSPGGVESPSSPTTWSAVGQDPGDFGLGKAMGSAGDFNGDGQRDIVAWNGLNSPCLYLGDGSGRPSDAPIAIRDPYLRGRLWLFTSVLAGDVDGDGSDDLLVEGSTFFGSSRASIYSGSGIGMGDGLDRGSITSLRQFSLEGGPSRPRGDHWVGGGVMLEAKVSAGSGGTVQFEVREAGDPFDGVPTAEVVDVPRGGNASLRINLPSDRSYHWQARLVPPSGPPAPWLGFGSRPEVDPEVDFRIRTNSAPEGRVAVQQSDDGAPIHVGGFVMDRTITTFETLATDRHGDDYTLEIEVRPVGVALTGVATLVSKPVGAATKAGAGASYSPGSYHWQWRVVDALQAAGPWVHFGGNPESDSDFVVEAYGSGGKGACAASGTSTPWAAGAILPLLAPFVPRRRRARLARSHGSSRLCPLPRP